MLFRSQVRSPHGEVKLLLLPCSFLSSVDRLQTCSLSCMRVLVSVLGFLFCLSDPASSSWWPQPPLYRAGGLLYMCGTGCLHTDRWVRLLVPAPSGPATVFVLPTGFLPSGIVDSARYGDTAVGDVRSRVARFLSCRLRLRRFRVGGRRRGRRGAGGSSMLPCRRVSDGTRWLTSPRRRSGWQMASRMDAAGRASSRPGSLPAQLLAGQSRVASQLPVVVFSIG